MDSAAAPDTHFYLANWYMALHLALNQQAVPYDLALRVVDVPAAALLRIAELACGRQRSDAPEA